MKRIVVLLVFLCLLASGSSQAQEACGIENCHGIDISCGPNVPEACTQMYALGDFCRDYARCERLAGKCRLVENPTFDSCVACVRKCMDAHANDPVESFNCEATCRDQIEAILDTQKTGQEKTGSRSDAGGSADTTAGFQNAAEGDLGSPCL
ncbi:MAG: hypothetical protein JNN05_09605 [Candidatus Omnitrophica bacterium]|nr:hypothetical protein [Candidatus Omnitrophota bacterium]